MGNTDCHGHKCPRNDVGELYPSAVSHRIGVKTRWVLLRTVREAGPYKVVPCSSEIVGASSARPRGRVCVLHRIWANAQRAKLPTRHCEGRKTRGNPRSGTASDEQRSKGNTDCRGHKCPRNDVGKYTRVLFHIGFRRIRSVSCADRPGGRSLQVRTMYGARKKTRAAARVFSYALSCFFSSLNTSRWTGIRSCLGLWELYHTRMRPANSGLTRGISGRVNPWAAYIYQ